MAQKLFDSKRNQEIQAQTIASTDKEAETTSMAIQQAVVPSGLQ